MHSKYLPVILGTGTYYIHTHYVYRKFEIPKDKLQSFHFLTQMSKVNSQEPNVMYVILLRLLQDFYALSFYFSKMYYLVPTHTQPGTLLSRPLCN